MATNLNSLFRAVWFTPGLNGRWGLPILIEGRPGTAKTSRISAAASDLNLPLETVIASLREPADFLGLPIPNMDGAQVHYAAPAWARRIAETGGVVFFDELNTAAPAVQAALLRCVLEGVVGDLVLPPTVRFVAAQNAVEDAAGGYDLAAPLANRFGHLSDTDVTVDAWASWLLSGASGGTPGHSDGINDVSVSTTSREALEAQVMKAWPEPYAKAKGLAVAFLRRKNLLLQQPKSGDPAASKAWPSPRSWDMAIRAMAGAEVHGLSEVDQETLVAAFIGLGAASEFAAYRRDMDLPDPASVLDGKVEWKPDHRRLDRTQAVLSACTALVCPQNADKRIDRAGALYDIMGGLVKGHADLVVLNVKALIESGLGQIVLGTRIKKTLEALGPVLLASGKLTPKSTGTAASR